MIPMQSLLDYAPLGVSCKIFDFSNKSLISVSLLQENLTVTYNSSFPFSRLMMDQKSILLLFVVYM